ncbi:MAG: hypothetical protein BEN19_02155 [Epulopiscium sp. Nuni2H_MBin003]|nr:MAG: hypothetical protein BEN19_02155 [Epulopiscium sp. Nuni2H_MBin003]
MRKILGLLTLTLITPVFANETRTDVLQEDRLYSVIINQTNTLKEEYTPINLVMPKVKFYTPGNIEKNYMELEAATHLEQMFNDAIQEGIILYAVSGYRSYERQKQLYDIAVQTYGEAQNTVAKPGQSGHQTGLVMDIVGESGHLLLQSFGNTKEGVWVRHNAHKYGFIIRYPKEKEHITGIVYEPWHIRYVGIELATYCYTNNMTLEEVDLS